jgi:hypothetical protein
MHVILPLVFTTKKKLNLNWNYFLSHELLTIICDFLFISGLRLSTRYQLPTEACIKNH